jgi:arylsulfatase A
MVEYVDKQLSTLVAKLEELGLRDNTLLVVVGDNGTAQTVTSLFKGRQVKGGKGTRTMWGSHVPCFASWPGQLAKGLVCQDLIDATDFLPTICEAADIEIPAKLEIDGVSFLPQLKGEKGNPREALYVWYNPYQNPEADKELADSKTLECAHDGKYKLYRNGNFFDLQADDLEKKPLSKNALNTQEKATHAKLQAVLDAHAGPRPAKFNKQN